jgi:hypothetical protein
MNIFKTGYADYLNVIGTTPSNCYGYLRKASLNNSSIYNIYNIYIWVDKLKLTTRH